MTRKFSPGELYEKIGDKSTVVLVLGILDSKDSTITLSVLDVDPVTGRTSNPHELVITPETENEWQKIS